MTRIYATSGPHALLQNNLIPTIGKITDFSQNFDSSGKTQTVTKVTFDFDCNGIADEFYFQDTKLVFYSINIIRRKYMREFYKVLIAQEDLDLETFITVIKEFYVNYEMGFYSKY